MNEETKKAEQIKKTEEEAKAAELSEKSLEEIAGGKAITKGGQLGS